MMSNNSQPPLDTWIEEEVEIPSFETEVDKRGNVVSVKPSTRKGTVKTIYSNPTPEKLSCPVGKHDYRITDKHKHIASCPNCMKNRYIRPVFENIRDGHIYSLDSGELID